MHKAIFKPSFEVQNSFWKVTLEKIWHNFLQVQLIKLSQVLEIVWQESMKG